MGCLLRPAVEDERQNFSLNIVTSVTSVTAQQGFVTHILDCQSVLAEHRQ